MWDSGSLHAESECPPENGDTRSFFHKPPGSPARSVPELAEFLTPVRYLLIAAAFDPYLTTFRTTARPESSRENPSGAKVVADRSEPRTALTIGMPLLFQ